MLRTDRIIEVDGVWEGPDPPKTLDCSGPFIIGTELGLKSSKVIIRYEAELVVRTSYHTSSPPLGTLKS